MTYTAEMKKALNEIEEFLKKKKEAEKLARGDRGMDKSNDKIKPTDSVGERNRKKKNKRKYCCIKCRNLDYIKRMEGCNSPNWQGGKTKEGKLKRTCSEYKEWRLKVFERDNFTCVKCKIKDRTIEAHHIKSQSEYPELIYNIDNGMILCHKCHKKTDNYGLKLKYKRSAT